MQIFKVTGLVVVVTLVVAFAVWTFAARQTRLHWLQQAEAQQDRVLAAELLADLIRDFPLDDEISSHVAIVHSLAVAERGQIFLVQDQLATQRSGLEGLEDRLGQGEATQKTLARRTTQVQSKLDEVKDGIGQFQTSLGTFQDQFGEFQQTIVQSSARTGTELTSAPITETDYLKLLLSKAPSTEKLSTTEVSDRLTQASEALSKSDWKGIRTLASSVLGTVPAHARAAALLVYASLRESPEAKDAVRRLGPATKALLLEDPRNYLVQFSAGALAASQNQWTEAEARFSEALSILPESFEAAAGRLEALANLGRTNEARELASGLWQRRAASDELALLVWPTFADAGVEAKTAFLVDWKSKLKSHLPEMYLGDLAAERESWAEAAGYYAASWQLRPTNSAFVKWADAEFRSGQYSAAQQHYRTLVDAATLSTIPGRADHQAFVQRLVVADEALEAWSDVVADGSRALGVRPELDVVRKSVGLAFLRLSDTDRAVSTLLPLWQREESVEEAALVYQTLWNSKKYDAIRNSLSQLQRTSANGWAELKTEWQNKLAGLRRTP